MHINIPNIIVTIGKEYQWIITPLATLFASFFGAFCAFKFNSIQNKHKKEKDELQKLYAYYGALLSTFSGYDRSADSFLEQGNKYSIERNYAKIKNYNDYKSLGFIAQNSIKFYKLIFCLEIDINILIEKITVYDREPKDAGSDHYTVARRQFLENFEEIIYLLINTANYIHKYYPKVPKLDSYNEILDKTKKKIALLIEITNKNSKLSDNNLFMERMNNKEEEWLIEF